MISQSEPPLAQADAPRDREIDPHRILLTEDNPVNQLIAQKQLELLGFEVDVADNGLEALAAIDRRRYDLVLMDCQMPRLDGYEATRRLRRHHNGRDLPVIAVTAHAIEGDREKCLAAGMDDYLAKPIRVENLSAMLGRWLPGLVAARA